MRALTALVVLLPLLALAQSQSAGTLRGLVTDETEARLPGAEIVLRSALTGYSSRALTMRDGGFALQGIPFGSYQLSITSSGFSPSLRSVELRSAVPLELTVRLGVAGKQTSVTVREGAPGLVENTAVTSAVVDHLMMAALPALTPGAGLNDAITFTSANVAADSNGFFHPLGDHAQVSYVIDGQPISDQRNKVFSTSIPENAIQSMELISGSPQAEYGDKTSLVVSASTRSGLGQKPQGSLVANYGSFGSLGEQATFAAGSSKWGNFLAFNSERTGRFLDSPEFRPIHDAGTSGTLFDRLDLQPGPKDAIHLNLMVARNWMQIPNTYDQLNQDQRQKVLSFNVAPGYQHTLDGRTLATVNAWFRRDDVGYYPSRNVFDDHPATLSQQRSLANVGVHADVARTAKRHNFKAGVHLMQTRLEEEFSLGITRADYNPPTSPGYLPGLAPYDLTRGGHSYQFRGRATISQVAWFVQDTITAGNFTFNAGLRYDYYNGLARGGGPQPRGAVSYLLKGTGTVLRAGFSHTLETPMNENLVVSSSTGVGGLAYSVFGSAAEQRAIGLGSRNSYDAGVQQSLGRWARLDVQYFRKYTRTAFDFDTLFSTPVTLPIGWKQSKLDGIGARISTPEVRGLRVWFTAGHANARFFGPETGGIVFNSALAVGAYRQDHDQVYQHNVNLRYQPVKNAWWGDFTWRYDSGLVVGAVNGLEDALGLTAAEQSAIGFFCGAERATLSHRIASCGGSSYGAERLHILAPGAENDDHNPPRAKARSIFHLAIGHDNILHGDRVRMVVRLSVLNLANHASLYNFLSPFSGTHWVQPRSWQARVGWEF